MTERKQTIKATASHDIKRLEKSLNAMNLWYILALYLLLILGSVIVVWTVHAKGITSPFMYLIACIALIAGITFRYFAISWIGRLIIGIFALAYTSFLVWVLFDQAMTGVMTSGDAKTAIHPVEFYLAGGLFSLAALMFLVQPIVHARRKHLISALTTHLTTDDETETATKTSEGDAEHDEEPPKGA